jgi:hypothetical protein
MMRLRAEVTACMETDKLIQRLGENSGSVRPLPRPWTRTLAWLALSTPYVALVVLVVSPRADLVEKLSDARFLLEQAAALATGVAAAAAAFATVIPGYSRKAALLPALSLTVWLGSLGQGSVETWLRFGSDSLWLEPDWICFPAIVLVGSTPAIALVAMLRRGAPLMPCTTVALGGLAAAGLGNFGLRLFHPQDASLMVLAWQFGSVAILTGLAGCVGRHVLNWGSLIGTARRDLASG